MIVCLEQVRKQLEKIVTVVRVLDVSSRDFVERDLAVDEGQGPRGSAAGEIRELVDIFRGKIVDVGPEEVMIEISGRENKVQAFIERMRPYGITELVRTGRIAMVRSVASGITGSCGGQIGFCLNVAAHNSLVGQIRRSRSVCKPNQSVFQIIFLTTNR